MAAERDPVERKRVRTEQIGIRWRVLKGYFSLFSTPIHTRLAQFAPHSLSGGGLSLGGRRNANPFSGRCLDDREGLAVALTTAMKLRLRVVTGQEKHSSVNFQVYAILSIKVKHKRLIFWNSAWSRLDCNSFRRIFNLLNLSVSHTFRFKLSL